MQQRHFDGWCTRILTLTWHFHFFGGLQAETGLLKASTLPAPAFISRFAPVGDAAAAMITKGAKFLVIVQGDLRHGAGLVKTSPTAYGERRAIGFVLEDMLF